MCEWAGGSAIGLIWMTAIGVGILICFIAYGMLQGYYFLGICLITSVLVFYVLFKTAREWKKMVEK